MVPMMNSASHAFAFTGTLRVKNELQSANKQQQEWGFLSGKLTRSLSTSSAPAQYHNSGAWTIKRIMVPEKADGNALPQVRCNLEMLRCPTGTMASMQIAKQAKSQGSSQDRGH